MGWREDLLKGQAQTAAWMKAREAELRHGAAALEAKGRQVYAAAVKTEQKVAAKTPAELRALGLAAVQGKLPQLVGRAVVKEVAKHIAPARGSARQPAPVTKATRQPTKDLAAEAKQQIRAGVSGAVDEFTFGLGDKALAAGDAILHSDLTDVEDLKKFGQRYDANMAEKRRADAFDAAHYGVARTTGRAAGLGASLAVMGAPSVGRLVVSRLVPRGAELVAAVAKAPRLKVLDPRGLTTLAAAGGAGNAVLGQGMSDAASGRLSSVGDYLGAGLGGAIGGVATLRQGPLRGGMVEGAVTSAAQDASKGKMPSIEKAIQSAHVGSVTAGIMGAAGTYGSAALPRRLKGELGEGMSILKTAARGKLFDMKLKQRIPLKDRGVAIPDQKIGDEFLESKLGPYADLTPAQRKLRRQDPSKFFIDAWQFSDVGKGASAFGGLLDPILTDDEGSPGGVR